MDYTAFFLGFLLGATIVFWFSIPRYYDAEKYQSSVTKVNKDE